MARPRRHWIHVRVNATERLLVELAASRSLERPGTWARRVLVEAATRATKRDTEGDTLRD